jgi:hypothetical protein
MMTVFRLDPMTVLTWLILALGARLGFLAAALWADAEWARPRHLQTTAIWLVGLALVRAALSRPRRQSTREALRPGAGKLWALFSVMALLLFWPALSVGVLSDDAGLLERARSWDIGG